MDRVYNIGDLLFWSTIGGGAVSGRFAEVFRGPKSDQPSSPDAGSTNRSDDAVVVGRNSDRGCRRTEEESLRTCIWTNSRAPRGDRALPSFLRFAVERVDHKSQI